MSEVMCIHCLATVKETDTTCAACVGQQKEQGNEKQESETNAIRCNR